MTRVLHVLRSDGFAGVERHVVTLAAAQAAAGHEVGVVGGDRDRMAAALAGTGVRTAPGDSVPQVLAQVRRAAACDVVHAHMTAGELAASLSTTTPLVVTRHFARPRGTTPVGRAASALVRRRLRAQIAISRYVAGAVDGPATVVYPGVAAVGEPPHAGRCEVVLVVQRLQEEKRTDVAVRAFAAAVAAPGVSEGWELHVVGRGPEGEALRRLADELGVGGRVRLLGFRDDVPDLMATASALVAPCEVEGLGLSVLEAMAHGLPVVASRAGAHPETVGSASGSRLFGPGDWAQAGSQLADLILDPSGREAYGRRLARVQRESFTPEAQVAGTEAVYREVLG